jgi:hypothetical protein
MDEDKGATVDQVEEDEFLFVDGDIKADNRREKDKLKDFFKDHGSKLIIGALIIALIFSQISNGIYKDFSKETLTDGLRRYVKTLEAINLELARTLNQDEFSYNGDVAQDLVEDSIAMLGLLRDSRRTLLLTYDDQDGIEAVKEIAARYRNFASDGKYNDYERGYLEKDYEYTNALISIVKDTLGENGISNSTVSVRYGFDDKEKINKVLIDICRESAKVIHREEFESVMSWKWDYNKTLSVNYTLDEAFDITKEIYEKVILDGELLMPEDASEGSREYYFNQGDFSILNPSVKDINALIRKLGLLEYTEGAGVALG